MRRVELRRQRFVTRRFELEWIASRNYLLPRLDAVGRYRWRGFGDDLLHSDSTGRPRFDNAYMDLTSGDFQEWQIGLELNVPIGYRREFAAVRNAELLLSRRRAVLKEQEHLVLHDAAAAVAEFDRAMVVAQTTASRLDAARTQLARRASGVRHRQGAARPAARSAAAAGRRREPPLPLAGRVRGGDQERALLQGHAAGLRRRDAQRIGAGRRRPTPTRRSARRGAASRGR